jgi:hypothetical protein
MDAAGGFVVVWDDVGVRSGPNPAFRARPFDATGQPRADAFEVASVDDGWYSDGHPDVAADSDGDFLVTWRQFQWTDESLTNPTWQKVYARQYGANGVAVGGRIVVSEGRNFSPLFGTSVAIDDTGDDAVVTWRQEDSDHGPDHIDARRLAEDLRPPVEAVSIGSGAWSPSFVQALAALGDTVYGATSNSTSVLPWLNIDRITLRLPGDVHPAAGDLRVKGVTSADYPVTGVQTTYDPRRNQTTATWALATPLRADRVRVEFGAAGGNTLVGGEQLFGLWLNVLPGDVNRSGAVLADDASGLKKRFFSTAAAPGTGASAYSVFADVNGDGAILASDFSEVKKRFFTTLPGAAAAAPQGAATSAPVRRTRPASRDLLA